MQVALSGILALVTEFVSYEDKHYTTRVRERERECAYVRDREVGGMCFYEVTQFSLLIYSSNFWEKFS